MKPEGSRGTIYGFSVLRVIFLLVALFLPCFFSFFHTTSYESEVLQSPFKLGIENITESFVASLTNKTRVALITDQTGVTQDGKTSLEVLYEKNIPVQKVFFMDEQSHRQALISMSLRYPLIKLIYSPNLQCTSKEFDDIDIIFFDMQDSGTSAYMTVSLLNRILSYGAQDKKTIVVLDRPNVLGGTIEGTLCTIDDEKLIIPIRHGMTVGEMARLIHHELKKQGPLVVIPMKNYHRILDELSPHYLETIRNINSWYDMTFLYPLTFITPFETGFDNLKMQCILLPETIKFNRAKWHELRLLLQDIGIDSSFHRSYNSQKKQYISGLRLFVKDIEKFSSIHALVTILKFFKQAGIPMSFSHSFDECIGTSKLRGFIMGYNEWQDVEQDINKQLKSFFNMASQSLLYKPLPRIGLV